MTSNAPDRPVRRVVAGASLILAALTFWISWWLMPDAATNDAAHILDAVGASRERVFASALVQLASSALFAPAVVYFGTIVQGRGARTTFAGATILAIGAMGMAADAVYHQAAYEMTAPDVDPAGIRLVLERMQTEDVRSLAPLMLAFFAGAIVLTAGLARAGALSRVVPAALIVALVPTALLAALGVARHAVVLGYFGLIAIALTIAGWIAIAAPEKLTR